eukprot:TRINITY_DN1746_c0_g4_i1.p1 TRINITY_DN1746_c0_g4~~TRINITY_DN1746_c0_g4_i1.p1  ORF type:complete len:479 (+),score=92.19 TRINITY_DN1746_c0_g4_i1:17-1453(+)
MEGYKSSLLELPLAQLQKEPRLQRERDTAATEDLQELAAENYVNLLSASDDISFVRAKIASTDASLSSLADGLVRLATASEQFAEKASQTLAELKRNTTTLHMHPQLLELLEIPQLMETCVRHQSDDLALELLSFAVNLSKTHRNVPVIQQLFADIGKSKRLMVSQLLQLLRDNVQLPVCLRAVSYLRRLGVYNEPELRWMFLYCRAEWLNNKISEEVMSNEPDQRLRQLAECNRNGLFDIATQFRALFSEDAVDDASSRLLTSWITDRLFQYISILEHEIGKIVDGGALNQVYDDCIYFGNSLSSIKCDCKALFLPIFEGAIMTLVGRSLRTACTTLVESMRVCQWSAIQPSASATPVSAAAAAGDSVDQYAPPTILLQFTPLALLTNDMLTALNDLRQCALLSLREHFIAEFQRVFQVVVDTIAAFRANHTLRESETAGFAAFSSVAVDVCLPYLSRCLNAVYKEANLHVPALQLN